MDKEALIEYSCIQEEVKDIRRRICRLEEQIEKLDIVCDSVKGTRPDGIYGSIRIEGFPTLEYHKKKAALERNRCMLGIKEAELLEQMTQAEEMIESIEDSELRLMFRLYYIDGMTWPQVAGRMNQAFPKRKIKYTKDGCRKKNQRFFEENKRGPQKKQAQRSKYAMS